MITPADASAQILEDVHHTPVEPVPLSRALGCVVASDVSAAFTHPQWRTSSMDGYAIRASDVRSVPAKLRVIESIRAGEFAKREIAAGEATKLMTGTAVPDGADSVVRLEDTDGGNESVTILDSRDLGRNVRPAGEDYVAGDLLLRAGETVTPGAIGVLASAGVVTIPVYRAPTVAIVTSGNELVMLDRFDEVRAGKKIVSSSSYALPALVRDAGGSPCDYGIARDDPNSLHARIEAARGCDLLITTAGVSVGEHDFTRRVIEEMGGRIKFWKVRMRPGAPLAFGFIDGTPWIGLSGNPVSAMVTFELFVRPAIRKMRGHSALFAAPVAVRLAEPVTTHAPLTHFLRAVVTHEGGANVARLTGTQSSGALTSMMRANALLVVPHDRQRVEANETLQALPLTSDFFTAERFPA